MTIRRRKPNVVFILSDDMSWRDMGCYGQDLIATPNLDALAGGGTRFSACYAGSPVCAPARSTIMQGKHQGHAAVRENFVSPEEGINYRHCLQRDDFTLAHVFKKAGYRTGMFGKWGLALKGQSGLPGEAGFDSFFGYLNQRKAHNYYPEHLWRNEDKIELPENKGHNHRAPNEYDSRGHCIPNGLAEPEKASYSFDLCHQEALQFVRECQTQPFFLYLPVTIPHGAHEVPELGQYKDKNWSDTHKIYAAMITRLDSAVGELVELLKDTGQYENTLIIFASDNGYSHRSKPGLDEFFRHSGPFKGDKEQLQQGGVRVPAFVHWPGHSPAGRQCDIPWAFYDLLPTICELTGVKAPDDIDGVSVLPAFTGQAEKVASREFLYWEFRDEQAARIDNYWAWRPHPEADVELYHADYDPAQLRNLASYEKEIVKKAIDIFATEHERTLYFPEPGESRENWRKRLSQAGIELPDNVND